MHLKQIVFSLFLLICSNLTFGQKTTRIDSCGINDSCEKAILIPNVASDAPFVCIKGCNLNAAPAPFNNYCGIGDFPTVWFKVETDNSASVMNINVQSDDINAPAISLFYPSPDCSHLQLTGLTQTNLGCITGSNGEVEAIGSRVSGNSTYYIAVSSPDTAEGQFTICVNTISESSACVKDANIEIKARSYGGSLTGPFSPGEIISVCLNVNSYSAADNGCQWFQGLIPRFGNGWDPSSFDVLGQPKNATINGYSMGEPGNGLYGASTWDWFTDIGYHSNNPRVQIADLDGNGTTELCNLLYEVDCPNMGGIIGGCCGPCWADAGDPLPPGWFAYGINGTCPTPGPPPTVDWGDGNSCSEVMGPWHFCFDLKVRDYPDCLSAQNSDLTIGFITTADGETGSWTGGPSICQNDQPLKLNFPLSCFTQTDLGTETLPDVCAEEEFYYQIFEPGISHWTWGIDPSYAVIDSVHEADNGYVIESELNNPSNHTLQVTYTFLGQVENSQNTVIKKVKFNILAPIKISFVISPMLILSDTLIVCSADTNSILISAEVEGGTGNYSNDWWPFGTTTPTIIIIPPFYSTGITLNVSDDLGCTATKNINVIVDQNCIINHVEIHNDESNDGPTKGDSIGLGGNGFGHPIEKRSSAIEEKIKIYPNPSKERIIIEWSRSIHHPTLLNIFDTSGRVMETLNIDTQEINHKEVDIHNLIPGVYILTLHSDHEIRVGRVVKI